jgi:hypothetical protein
MPLNTLIPYFEPGDRLSATATATVVGKTFLAISGNLASDNTFQVATCAEYAKPLGVCEYDAASGQWVGVVCEGIVPVTCGSAGALTAGTEVMSDASGNAIAWDSTVGHRPAGMCLNGATVGSDAMIRLYK